MQQDRSGSGAQRHPLQDLLAQHSQLQRHWHVHMAAPIGCLALPSGRTKFDGALGEATAAVCALDQ